MKFAYLDCFSGVSGNMLLAALLDCGLREDDLRDILQGLQLPGWAMDIERATTASLAARLVRVRATNPAPHRHLKQIREIIAQAVLPAPVKETAQAVFLRLAKAEADVHGTTMDKVHFHEVGAVDAIIDIVGVVSGFHLLDIRKIVCSPLPMPSGWVACAHGSLPLPAPAVCNLLRKVPVYGTSLAQELVTPTGAALVAELAHSFGTMPPMIIGQTGYGAGTMQRKDGRPNMLRIITGQSETTTECQQVQVIETNLDDWNPELWPYVAERLMKAGALDVSLTPMHMKKGRAGYLLRVIADQEHSLVLQEIVLTETSSIGLRFHTMDRMTLPRQTLTVQTPWGKVQAKQVRINGRERITPEYEECKRIALDKNVALQDVYAAVARAVAK
jgi:uncharacterized protein (TIGR00299 family) protein